MSTGRRSSFQSIQPAGTWWGEPAGGEVLGCHPGVLFVAKVPSSRRRTWGVGLGTGEGITWLGDDGCASHDAPLQPLSR